MAKSFERLNVGGNEKREQSAGNALRNKLFNKISPILQGSDHISDSDTRLMIQASCLDMVAIVEDLIEEYELDFEASRAN